MERLACIVLSVAMGLSGCGNSERETETSTTPEWAYDFGDTCRETSNLDTSSWRLIEGGTISFRVPPGYAHVGVGMDAEGTRFEKGQNTFGYCWPCAPYTGSGAQVRCREIIDGRESFISKYGPGPDGRFFTGATWLAGRDPRIAYQYRESFLVMGGSSCDEAGQQEVLAAIRSVQFASSNRE